MPEVRNESHSNLAYRSIRELIERGEMVAGTVVSENFLARKLRMSRTPVREAVQRLVHEGLLTSFANRGTMVSVMTVRDVEETYAIREALESLAAALAAERVTTDGADQLDAIIDAAEESLPNEDTSIMIELDQKFHAEVAELSGNARLARLLETMRGADFLGPGRPHRASHRVSVEEHRAIAAAIRSCDSREAESRMRNHIRSSSAFIAETIFGARVGHEEL